MSDFIVHLVPGSPYARAVLTTLEEKGARYRVAAVASLRAPEHLARHPFGKVPVLEHGEYRLYETQAILRYLDRVLPSPPLTPAEPRGAGKMDQLLNVSDAYLFRGVCNIIAFQRIVAPRLLGAVPDEAAIAAAMPQARTVVAVLEQGLGEHQYFTGETLSLADVLLAAQLDFLARTPEWAQLGTAAPRLCAWLGRLRARPSMAATTWERVAALAQAA